MISRVWIINSILALALVVCCVKIYDVWNSPAEILPEKKAIDIAEKSKPLKKISHRRISSESEYQEVVDNNLFSSERRTKEIENQEVEDEETGVKISGETITLFGVILLDDVKKALINDPESKRGEKKSRWIEEGNKVGNLKVKKILHDYVVFTDGSTKYKVLLYDPEKVKKAGRGSKRKKSVSAEPKVISAGEVKKAKKQTSPGTSKKAKSKKKDKVTISEDGQYEIIETPLGKIKRKRK